MQERYPGEPDPETGSYAPEGEAVPLPQEPFSAQTESLPADVPSAVLPERDQMNKQLFDELTAATDPDRRRELFARFFVAHRPLFRHILTQGFKIPETEYEDVIQSSWERLQKYFEKGGIHADNHFRLAGFMKQTIINAAMSNYRKADSQSRRSGRLISLEQLFEEGGDTAAGAEGLNAQDSTEQEALGNTQIHEVVAFLQREYGERAPDLIHLILGITIRGDTHKELAEDLGIQVGTAKSRAFYAMQKIRAEFGQSEEGEQE